MQSALRQVIKKTLRFVGYSVWAYQKDWPELWSKFKDFQLLFEEIKAKTVVTQDRCFMLYQLAKYANSKDGEVAELGVYKGGSAKLISKTCPKKEVHLFDTFSGMPEEDPAIAHRCKGDFLNISLESVKEFLTDCHNVVFHPGFFPDTADVIKDKRFCFVYMDGDLYQSAKDCLEFFYDKMVSGGVIVFDDYEWKDCPGVKEALDEFFVNKPENLIVTAKYQVAMIKI